MKHDWKKSEKQFYAPKSEPEKVSISAMNFFSIRGEGDPNNPEFGEYISVLYSLSYGVKMSPKQGFAPVNYFEYSIYPLEGVWDLKEEARTKSMEKIDKDALVFNLMIRQPEFVTPEFAAEVIQRVSKKKPHPLLAEVKFETLTEGDCVQMLHTGSYDDEPASFARMEAFAVANGLKRQSKIHREIYLSDARKTAPEKLRTILRFLVE
ncbi:MAG TPA: GyrI-like domain-containing protein [Paludibacter sp.]|nr:GyrI-like domain-containing protein [Paludibacter sp.]